MKIKVIDLNQVEKNEQYKLGFRSGRQNTKFDIVAAHEAGESLEHIYSVIKKQIDNLEY